MKQEQIDNSFFYDNIFVRGTMKYENTDHKIEIDTTMYSSCVSHNTITKITEKFDKDLDDELSHFAIVAGKGVCLKNMSDSDMLISSDTNVEVVSIDNDIEDDTIFFAKAILKNHKPIDVDYSIYDKIIG